jgi:hypothetical protein
MPVYKHSKVYYTDFTQDGAIHVPVAARQGALQRCALFWGAIRMSMWLYI